MGLWYDSVSVTKVSSDSYSLWSILKKHCKDITQHRSEVSSEQVTATLWDDIMLARSVLFSQWLLSHSLVLTWSWSRSGLSTQYDHTVLSHSCGGYSSGCTLSSQHFISDIWIFKWMVARPHDSRLWPASAVPASSESQTTKVAGVSRWQNMVTERPWVLFPFPAQKQLEKDEYAIQTNCLGCLTSSYPLSNLSVPRALNHGKPRVFPLLQAFPQSALPWICKCSCDVRPSLSTWLEFRTT